MSASFIQKWGPGCIILSYLAGHWILGGLRGDHFLISSAVAGLYYLGHKSQNLLRFLMPLFLVLIVYDSQQYFASYVRAPVHIRGPYELEMMLFGVGEITPARWLQSHTHPLLDGITGLAYLCFVPAYVLMAGYLYFYLPFRLRGSALEVRYRWIGHVMMQAFMYLTLTGYATHLIFPAAPPWYVDLYGFEFFPDVPAEAAGAVRFDLLVGLPVFEAYYAKSTNVFGAIPSLHCGQTFLAMWFAFMAKKMRIANGLLFTAVLFGSVYLNHHYIIDGLLGVLFAAIVGLFVLRLMKRKAFIV